MTFLLDHCIWKQTEDVLRGAGFNCITLRELGKVDAQNGEVISTAKSKGSVLVTRDRDFGNFTLYPLGTHQGIILLRITPKSMEKVHKMLLETLQSVSIKDIKGSLLIVTSATYRIHRSK